MQPTYIDLKIQPPRSKNQKVRLANNLRKKGYPEDIIKKICWHRENSPKK